MSKNTKEMESGKKSRFIDVVMSVLAAMFGVQSQKNRERDFEQESLLPYLVTAVVMMVVLIVILAEISSYIANIPTK